MFIDRAEIPAKAVSVNTDGGVARFKNTECVTALGPFVKDEKRAKPDAGKSQKVIPRKGFF